MTLLDFIGKVVYTVLKTTLATEEYELHMVLTDKNNIVIHEETYVYQQYTLAQVDDVIYKMKELGRDE